MKKNDFVRMFSDTNIQNFRLLESIIDEHELTLDLVKEDVDFEFEDKRKGGVIVFSHKITSHQETSHHSRPM